MFFKSIVFLFVFLCSSVIGTNPQYETIKNLVDLDKLGTKIATKLDDTDEAQLITLKMLDACSKIPSGILEGKLMDLGSFDECYNIEYKDIYGKYCLGTLPFTSESQKYYEAFKLNVTQPRRTFFIHPQPKSMKLGGGSTGITLAVCMPSSMSAAEISGLIQISEDLCYSKATEPALSSGAIVTISVLAIFLCLVILSTSYDLIIAYLKKEPYHELLISFSFLTNGKKIFRSSQNSDQLLCLNGIKAISMMWVILGHSYSIAMTAPLSNSIALVEFLQDSANMFLLGATVSVDTFFLVGGVVTVYSFLRSMDKGVKFNVPLFYLHRYLRLTPAYFIVGLINTFLIDYMGNGGLWTVVNLTLVESCKQGWWSSLLYVANYVNKGICLPQAWYLSVDMQLFVLSPIVLIVLARWPKVGLGSLGLLTIAGCVVPFAIGYDLNLGSMLDNQKSNDYMQYYYIKTHARFGPYVIGLLVGYYIFKIKKSEMKLKLQKWMVLTAWSVLLTGLVACVYAGYPLNVATEEDRWGNFLFLAFNRPAWAVAVAGVILLCVAGYGGPIDTFLSLPIFQFLTKLSYSMYLVHYSVITVRYASMRNNMTFSHSTIMHAFWGDFMFTLALSLVLCLTFESPVIILEKYLFGRGTPPKRNEKKAEV